ncbi:MAG TPA: acyltransferase, partial [Candidatus Saccharimonadales bacterium]|nr:acyltransferase [Candidatus Saccharimonadales bacterium]
MEKLKQTKYDPAIDLIRIISILAVIMIHTSTRTLEASHFQLTKTPWTLFLNQISRFAVPVFFMLSGFVLELNFQFHLNYLNYLKKRITRIFVPFVFWSGIYYFIVYRQHTEGFFQSVVSGDASYQLYFIPSLLIFYFFFPLINKYYSLIFSKLIIIPLGILEIYLLYFDYSVKPLNIYSPIKIVLLNYFIFILGVFCGRHKTKIILEINKWRYLLLSLTFLVGGFVFYEGFDGYMKTKNYLTFYSQWRVSVLIYSILISGVLYNLFQRNLPKRNFIKKLSSLTFFIFFIHVIVLELIWSFFGIPIF